MAFKVLVCVMEFQMAHGKLMFSRRMRNLIYISRFFVRHTHTHTGTEKSNCIIRYVYAACCYLIRCVSWHSMREWHSINWKFTNSSNSRHTATQAELGCESINQSYSSGNNNHPAFIFAVVVALFIGIWLADVECAPCVQESNGHQPKYPLTKCLTRLYRYSLILERLATHVHNSSMDHIFSFHHRCYVWYDSLFWEGRRKKKTFFNQYGTGESEKKYFVSFRVSKIGQTCQYQVLPNLWFCDFIQTNQSIQLKKK